VLTGDSLFVGDVARPDLAVEPDEGAHGMFRTLHERLLTLPDACEVWPAHLGGSLCGGPGMDMKVSSTIGYERRHNDMLGIEDEDAFVERVLGELAPQPPNFESIVAINRGPLVTGSADLMPLTPRQVEQKAAAGALIVDVRTDLQFDDAHIPGSVSNTLLRAGFGTKLAWIADRDQEIVFVGRDDDDGRLAARLAAVVGITNLGGFLAGGATSWRAEERPVARIERIGVDELRDREGEVQILDVRERDEWDAGHIPGSVHEPYHDIDAMPEGIDPAKPVAAICMSGQRSAVAASLLERHGAERVIHVADGGVGTWRRRGYPIED
jgi:rhodanese-related sulfurtransferase